MKHLKEILLNDKFLVIVSVLGITIVSVSIFGVEAKEIVTNAFSGLFGIAVGRALGKTN